MKCNCLNYTGTYTVDVRLCIWSVVTANQCLCYAVYLSFIMLVVGSNIVHAYYWLLCGLTYGGGPTTCCIHTWTHPIYQKLQKGGRVGCRPLYDSAQHYALVMPRKGRCPEIWLTATVDDGQWPRRSGSFGWPWPYWHRLQDREWIVSLMNVLIRVNKVVQI